MNSMHLVLLQEMLSQSFVKFAEIWHLRIIPMFLNSCFFGFILLFRMSYTGNFILYSNTAGCNVTHIVNFPVVMMMAFVPVASMVLFDDVRVNWHLNLHCPLGSSHNSVICSSHSVRFFSGVRRYTLVKFFAIGKNHYGTLFVHTEHYWPGNLAVQCFVFLLLCVLSIFEKCCLSTHKFYSYFSGSCKLPLSSLLNYFCIKLEENSLFWVFPFLHIYLP